MGAPTDRMPPVKVKFEFPKISVDVPVAVSKLPAAVLPISVAPPPPPPPAAKVAQWAVSTSGEEPLRYGTRSIRT